MAKARKYPITKIDVSLFTSLMKTHLKIALERYSYLMNEFSQFKNRPYNPDDDFVFEYYDYYALKAALKDFSNPIVKELYFKLLANPTSNDPVKLANDFAIIAKTQGIYIGDHLSFCSKICHTNDPSIPIYDSRIKEYLSKIYGVKDSYKDIYNWYYTNNPLVKNEQKYIIDWFRKTFSSYNHISDIKVLDTIIFVWHKYYK